MPEEALASDRPSSGPTLAALVVLCLFVRALHLVQVAHTPIMDYHRAFHESDMYMFDQWARRIAAGDLLGREVYHPLNGWQLATAPLEKWKEWYGIQPTFYKGPFYAYLIAALYWAFGDTPLPLFALQIVASCVSLALLYLLSERFLGSRTAFAAGILFALYGPAIHYDVLMLRGPWIVLVSLLVAWQLAAVRAAPTMWGAIWLGVAAGTSVWVNEGFVVMLPLLLVALPRRGSRRLFALVGAFALGVAAIMAPLFVRNAIVGAPPFKVAVTGSTVYAVFNSAGTNPYFFEARQSSFVPVLRQSGGALAKTVWACLRSFPGPVEVLRFYLRKATGLAIPFENPDNANFYYACLKDPLMGMLPGQVVIFPLGLLGLFLAARRPGSVPWPLLPPALSLLIACLVAIPLSRYRVALVVYLIPFAGLTVTSAVRWWKDRAWLALSAAVILTVLVGLAARAWQDRVVFGGAPPGVYLYRPPEFLLGAQIDANGGRYGAAIREISDLLRLNPDSSFRPTALLLAADIQVRSGDRAAARETLEALARSRRDDPLVLMAIGDFVRNALADTAKARAFYAQALSLGPPPATEDALRSRLAGTPSVEAMP
jgi:Tetratricopeptide repeat/Dolichyl-phosphate-mannose-protein mannosyltransferase